MLGPFIVAPFEFKGAYSRQFCCCLRARPVVPQVYLGLPASAGEPPKRLVAWEKVQLDPSQSRTVTVSLEPQFMSVFNIEKDAWELLPGDYLVSAGGSSRHTPLTATLHIPVESR